MKNPLWFIISINFKPYRINCMSYMTAVLPKIRVCIFSLKDGHGRWTSLEVRIFCEMLKVVDKLRVLS